MKPEKKLNLPVEDTDELMEPTGTDEPVEVENGDAAGEAINAYNAQCAVEGTRMQHMKGMQLQFEALPAKYSTTHLGVACLYVHQSISGSSTPANVFPFNQVLDATDIQLVEMFGGGTLISAAATLLASGRF